MGGKYNILGKRNNRLKCVRSDYKEEEETQLNRRSLGVGKLRSSKAIIYPKRNYSPPPPILELSDYLDIKDVRGRPGGGGSYLAGFSS